MLRPNTAPAKGHGVMTPRHVTPSVTRVTSAVTAGSARSHRLHPQPQPLLTGRARGTLFGPGCAPPPLRSTCLAPGEHEAEPPSADADVSA